MGSRVGVHPDLREHWPNADRLAPGNSSISGRGTKRLRLREPWADDPFNEAGSLGPRLAVPTLPTVRPLEPLPNLGRVLELCDCCRFLLPGVVSVG
jgi:hypothetical protein